MKNTYNVAGFFGHFLDRNNGSVGITMILIWITLAVATFLGSIFALNKGLDAYRRFARPEMSFRLDEFGYESNATPPTGSIWQVALYCVAWAALTVGCVLSAKEAAALLGYI